MKLRSTILAISPFLLLLSSACFSLGYTGDVQVDGTVHAKGSMQGARNSYDSVQSIGCQVNVTVVQLGSQTTLVCSATNASGQSLSCTMTNPDKKYLRTILSISDTSVIEFTRESTGECDYIWVSNGSNTY